MGVTMTTEQDWIRYDHIPILETNAKLRRMLLGKRLSWTIKEDGQNVIIWTRKKKYCKRKMEVVISSHNQEIHGEQKEMWFIEKYLALKYINKSRLTRYQIRKVMNGFLSENLGKKLSICSFYRLTRELEDSGLVLLEPEIYPCGRQKLGYYGSSRDLVIEKCYLSPLGEYELKKLEGIIRMMLLQDGDIDE